MFQSCHIVFIEEHRFVITGIFGINLVCKALCLVFCIVELREAVTDLTTTDKELKTVGNFRVHIIATSQR